MSLAISYKMKDYFKQRLGCQGDLKEISKKICNDFKLGDFLKYKIIPIGYEDFNFSLETTNGKFFVKIFSKERTLKDCKRNVNVLIKSLEAGISTPELYQSNQGYLHLIYIGKLTLRLCVMSFVDGEDFFTSKTKVTKENILTLAQQASSINSIEIKPLRIYDPWAVPNFPIEFEKKSQYLEKEDLELIQPLLEKFKNLNVETLPYCFTHGDIIKTNIIKDGNNKIWIVDFSVSNYYPRIQELAVLACDILFNENDKEESEQNLKNALEEYQKTIKLTSKEIKLLPIYIKFAHAMHLLLATYEKKAKNNKSKENEYFLKIGRSGLI